MLSQTSAVSQYPRLLSPQAWPYLPLIELQGLAAQRQLLLHTPKAALQGPLFLLQLLYSQQLGIHLRTEAGIQGWGAPASPAPPYKTWVAIPGT